MEQTVNWEKVYVDTLVRHTKDGGSIPLSIKFSDGKTYEIDQVLGRKRAAASKVGGTGIRYSIHSSLKMKACGLLKPKTSMCRRRCLCRI